MKSRFLKSQSVAQLRSEIMTNLSRYREGNFSDIIDDPSQYFEGEFEINGTLLSQVCTSPGNLNDPECCKLLYSAIGSISRYVARDERMWVYLTHMDLLDYSRTRWPIPADDEQARKHIETHFFAQGARGFERNNAASRLWWMAFLCSRVADLEIEIALECLLHQSDVRAGVIERPTTSQNVDVFCAVLNQLHLSYHADKSLFIRKRFRSFMKQLNLIGGFKLLAALPRERIAEMVRQCAASAQG